MEPPMGVRTDRLNVTISKTSDGKDDYMQIISGDQFSINVVLIASQITVEDHREQ